MRRRFTTLLFATLTTAALAATPRTMTGLITNSAGQPLAGAQVFAGSTLFFNQNALGVSGRDGRYRVSVPNGSWYGGAQITRSFQGEPFTFDLVPNTTSAFAGSAGAVRNFQWKLSGRRADGSFIGATVTVYTDFFDPDLLALVPDIELTLTPTGPLIDGSRGRVIRQKITRTAEGMEGVQDVPLGTYAITARHVPATGAPLDLTVRLRNTGEFRASTPSKFRRNGSGQLMEVEVSRAR